MNNYRQQWAAALAFTMTAGLFLSACGGGGDVGGSGGAGGMAGASNGGAGGSGGSGGSGTPDAGNPAGVGYARDIKPIFADRCNDCHYPGSATDYDFTNPFDPVKGIINRPNSWAANGSKETKIVDPGNVANSFLIRKVVETTLDDHVDGFPMPYHLPRLTPAELEAVRQWITSGAANDQFFAASVAPIFGTKITLGRESGKCTFCHYRGSAVMSVLDVFDPAQGMVGRNSKYGGVMVQPGDPDNSSLWKKLTGNTAGPQMPLHRDRLFPNQVQLLRDWITAGAPNN